MDLKNLQAYEILEQRPVADLNSEGAILRHKKTGARIVLLSNDDENKVFYIGFRTPPTDSTGVAHIIEHSVLCGSDKYPVKDPFVELAKGSLNTFLNAMTYPDKTVYPVASCNDKDFANLMDVYLDAVFHPRIYREKMIFEQEGWHYEVDEDGKLFYNGVVYNEMKGAFSSADDVLDREIMNGLFPETSYGVESGGKPENIPDLTYEAFLEFHSRYYHPSNSYIYLYGNMDMAEKLEYLDREYLSAYEAIDIDSALRYQTQFEKRVDAVKTYPVLEADERENNYYYALSVAAQKGGDPIFYTALDVLDHALCSSPGAPIKEALTKAGIGEDNYSSVEGGILQPFFSFISKNAKEGEGEKFLGVLEETLRDVVKNGLDKDTLNAAINLFAFRYKEADFGSYPKGLMYGLQALDSWLYDDMAPFLYIEANETFRTLRKKVDEGYFEKMIQTLFLDNPHKVFLTLKPSKTMAAEQAKAMEERLAAYQETLSDEELEKVRIHANDLKAYQASEDKPEDLKKLPMLGRGDLKKEAQPYSNIKHELSSASGEEVPVWQHDYFTNGVSYIRILFDITDFPDEDLFTLGILKYSLGLVNTKNYSYAKLNNEINLRTGGISTPVSIVVSSKRKDEKTLFEFKARCFEENTKDAILLIREMMFETDYSDTDRMLEILLEMKAGQQASMQSAGHQTAIGRANAMLFRSGYITDQISGLAFLDRLSDMITRYDEVKEKLAEDLTDLLTRIVSDGKLSVDYVGKEQGLALLRDAAAPLVDEICACHKADAPEVKKENIIGSGFEKMREKAAGKGYHEALVNSSDVCYVCNAGDFLREGLAYTGALKVLRVMMGYDYLWLNVRVQGGAYGCMSTFARTGCAAFVSYRDPNLQKTIDVYKAAPDYIENFEADEDEMTKYIIGTIAGQDMPLTPKAAGQRSWSAMMADMTFEDEQKERDEIIACTCKDIRALAAHLRAMLGSNVLCVNGKEELIKASQELFDEIRPMFIG